MHASYYIAIYGISGSTKFFDFILQTARFSEIKGYWYKMFAFIFSTTTVWNISHFTKNSARHYHKRTNVFTQSTPCSCQILMKLEFTRHLFEQKEKLKYQILSKHFSWEPSCSMRTDRQIWRNKFSLFANLRTRLEKNISYVLHRQKHWIGVASAYAN